LTNNNDEFRQLSFLDPFEQQKLVEQQPKRQKKFKSQNLQKKISKQQQSQKS